MRAVPLEQSYVEGRLKIFPHHLPRPPDWALAAARIASKRIMAPIAHLKPKDGKQYSKGDLSELLGYGRMLISYVYYPTKEWEQTEKDLPGLAKVREPLKRKVDKLHRRLFCKKLTARDEARRREIPTREQIKEWSRRTKEGVDGFEDEKGEPRAMQTMLTRIYYYLWFFWPELEHRFTGPDIQDWLKADLDETPLPSDKTVEAIVTRLRKDARQISRNPNFFAQGIGPSKRAPRVSVLVNDSTRTRTNIPAKTRPHPRGSRESLRPERADH
jgi:hypothetical protein